MADVITTKADFDEGIYIDTMSEEIPGIIPPDCLTLGEIGPLSMGTPANMIPGVGHSWKIYKVAQSITLDSNLTIDSVNVRFANGGTGDPILYMTVVPDIAGDPDTSTILAESDHRSVLPWAEAFRIFNFPPVSLTPNIYWLVLQAEDGTPPNNFRILRSGKPSSYPFGHMAGWSSTTPWWYHQATTDMRIVVTFSENIFHASGSWKSDERVTPPISRVANYVFDIVAGSGDVDNYISKVDIVRTSDMTVVGTYLTPIRDDITLTPADFGITERPTFDWLFDVYLIGDTTTSIQLNSITTDFVATSLYNAVLLDFKRAIVAEYPEFNVEIAGTDVPKRDALQPYIYIIPININTEFNPIGHKTNAGHGEGQIWGFKVSVIARRNVFVRGRSESEMLRNIGELMYKFFRNTEENLRTVFLETYEYIRYFHVGNLSSIVYAPKTEESRIDLDVRIEFNKTRPVAPTPPPSPYLFYEPFDYEGPPDPTKWPMVNNSSDCGDCEVDGDHLRMPGIETQSHGTFGNIWTDFFFSQKEVEVRADFLMPTDSSGIFIDIFINDDNWIRIIKPVLVSTVVSFQTRQGGGLIQSSFVTVSAGFHVFKISWTSEHVGCFVDGGAGPIHTTAITGNAQIGLYGIEGPKPSGTCAGPILYDYVKVYR